ncbi:uncharacterized protein ACJ7VT_017894 isoform 2-T2 [Polymixia lowei]
MVYTPMKAAITSSNHTSSTPDKAPVPSPGQKKSSVNKWKSTFKPAGESSPSQDKSPSSSERGELYDPYDPGSSESDPEMPHGREDRYRRPKQGNRPGHPGYDLFAPDRGRHDNHHWEASYTQQLNMRLDRQDLSPNTRHPEGRGPSPSNRLTERRAYSPDARPPERLGYGSITRPLDHRGFSPDRPSFSSSDRLMPASEMSKPFPPALYGRQGSNGEERMTVPESRKEMTTTVRLSPPRFQMDYQHLSGYVGTGVDQIPPSSDVTRHRSRSPTTEMEKSPFTCELCEVELAKMEELEDHLESKSHWDTLEHIQQQNNYDDLAVAFLQEVMLFKVRQCSQALAESSVEALREKDHMTKVEMLHCAACKVYISTSASSVQNHLSSQEHLRNNKEFGMRQRHACLSKAETMMKKLKPQFEEFLKGGDPFE